MLSSFLKSMVQRADEVLHLEWGRWWFLWWRKLLPYLLQWDQGFLSWGGQKDLISPKCYRWPYRHCSLLEWMTLEEHTGKVTMEGEHSYQKKLEEQVAESHQMKVKNSEFIQSYMLNTEDTGSLIQMNQSPCWLWKLKKHFVQGLV